MIITLDTISIAYFQHRVFLHAMNNSYNKTTMYSLTEENLPTV